MNSNTTFSDRILHGVMNYFLRFLLGFLCAMFVVSLGSTVWAHPWDHPGGGPEVKLVRLGKPTWKPVDFHLFAKELPAFDDNLLVNLQDSLLDILGGEGDHTGHEMLFIGPGNPHDSPYDKEFEDGLDELGIPDQKRFSRSQINGQNALFFTFMVVAMQKDRVPKGSSPDFIAGSIIPNEIYPIISRSTLFRYGKPFDSGSLDVSVKDEAGDLFFPGTDGQSHFPFFGINNENFCSLAAPPCGPFTKGRYKQHRVLLDQQGNGWELIVKFKVIY